MSQYFPIITSWTLLITTNSFFFYYPGSYFFRYYPWTIAVTAVLTFFVTANLAIVSCSDPGLIPKASQEDDDPSSTPLSKLIQGKGVVIRVKWCSVCKFYKPPRCSHCRICNRCVDTFDHHCPWINNCVGRRNYRFFFFFVSSLCAHISITSAICALYLLSNGVDRTNLAFVVTFSILLVAIAVFIPLIGLTSYHVFLIAHGSTTHEQLTRQYGRMRNPYSKGCKKNFCDVLCGPMYPSFKGVEDGKNGSANDIFVVSSNVGAIRPDNSSRLLDGNDNDARKINENVLQVENFNLGDSSV